MSSASYVVPFRKFVFADGDGSGSKLAILVRFERTMQPQLSTGLSLQALTLPSSAELNQPSLHSTAPSADLNLLTPASKVLRTIAAETPAEELSFFKYQVDARSSLVTPSSSESYLQGSLPSPHSLLQLAA